MVEENDVGVTGLASSRCWVGMLSDVTSYQVNVDVKGIEKSLGVEELMQQLYGDQCGILVTDVNGIILDMNSAFESLSTFSRRTLVGHKASVLSSGYHGAEFYKDLWGTILSGGSWRGLVCNATATGEYYWVDMQIFPCRCLSADGKQIDVFFSTSLSVNPSIKLHYPSVLLREAERVFGMGTGIYVHEEKKWYWSESLQYMTRGDIFDVLNDILVVEDKTSIFEQLR